MYTIPMGREEFARADAARSAREKAKAEREEARQAEGGQSEMSEKFVTAIEPSALSREHSMSFPELNNLEDSDTIFRITSSGQTCFSRQPSSSTLVSTLEGCSGGCCFHASSEELRLGEKLEDEEDKMEDEEDKIEDEEDKMEEKEANAEEDGAKNVDGEKKKSRASGFFSSIRRWFKPKK